MLYSLDVIFYFFLHGDPEPGHLPEDLVVVECLQPVDLQVGTP